jgi:hypothetical protein
MSKARVLFDAAQAREIITKAGHELKVVERLVDEAHGSFHAQVSKPDEKPLVVVEWHPEHEKWRVYVDDGDGILTSEVAKSFGSNVTSAAYLSDRLNAVVARDAGCDLRRPV